MLWRKYTPDNVGSLRIHGKVVIVAVDWYVTLLLDLPSGQTIFTLGSFGTSRENYSFFVFDGLATDVSFLLLCFCLFEYCCFLSILSVSHVCCLPSSFVEVGIKDG